MLHSVFNKILLASDHAGVNVKALVGQYLEENREFFDIQSLIDCGPFNANIRTDYPLYAKFLCQSISSSDTCGILLCARGIGMSIAANRFSHIRAALCSDVHASFFARSHSNANVLIISADAGYSKETIHEMLKTFLSTQFSGGRYQEPLDMIDVITTDCI